MAHANSKLFAHFYRACGGGFELILTVDTVYLNENAGDKRRIVVSGKREARRIAAECGAACWNF